MIQVENGWVGEAIYEAEKETPWLQLRWSDPRPKVIRWAYLKDFAITETYPI